MVKNKRYKRHLLTLLLASMVLSVTGCGNNTDTVEERNYVDEETDNNEGIPSKYTEDPKVETSELNRIEYEPSKKGIETTEEKEMSTNTKVDHNSSYADTCLNQLKVLGEKNENIVYSPMSLATALSLTEEVIEDGKAKDAIKEFVGNNEKAYLNIENSDTFKSVNRIWANKDKELRFNKEASKYVELLSMRDSGKATKEKNDYVAENTNNFITSTPTELNFDTIIDVMNIIYFKDVWDSEGGYDLTSDNIDFKNNDGTVTSTKMVRAYTDEYYENDTCYVVPLKYKYGNTMYFVKPKNGIENVEFGNIFDNPIYDRDVTLIFPEFESSVSMLVSNYFDEFGLSDFSEARLNIYNGDTRPPLISQVAKIKVDKDGTEAAAVTEVIFEKSCALSYSEPLKIVLDEAFYYMIEDWNTEDIAFIGRLMNLK